MTSNNLFEELVNGKGYVIVDVCQPRLFSELVDYFVNHVSSMSPCDDIDQVRSTICQFSNQQVNELMVKLLSFPKASDLVAKSFKDSITSVCGDRLFLQRRANIIMNLPGDAQRHQWPHYEIMSGVSPYTFILWAPFHDIDDDGGVYYCDNEFSFTTLMEEERLGLMNSPYMFEKVESSSPAPLVLRYGQAVLFNPFVIHGNKEFDGLKARIAVSIRFQNRDYPLMQRGSDFFKPFQFDSAVI